MVDNRSRGLAPSSSDGERRAVVQSKRAFQGLSLKPRGAIAGATPVSNGSAIGTDANTAGRASFCIIDKPIRELVSLTRFRR
jgi:hypothetical protein